RHSSRSPSPSPRIRPRMPLLLRTPSCKPLLPPPQLRAVARIAAWRQREWVRQTAEKINEHIVGMRAGQKPRRQHEIGKRHAADVVVVVLNRIADFQGVEGQRPLTPTPLPRSTGGEGLTPPLAPVLRGEGSGVRGSGYARLTPFAPCTQGERGRG